MLATDLCAEHDELRSLLAALSQEQWVCPTPSPGWDVRRQVDHLAFGDRTAVLALTSPAQYLQGWAQRATDQQAYAASRWAQAILLSNDELLAAWIAAATELCAVARTHGSLQQTVTWAGREMSVASLLTARLMETWAHGQDIADSIGRDRIASTRLRHIAHLGVRTRAHSYLVHGRAAPATDIRVELTAPDGASWRSGPDLAVASVRGPMVDFCLVVTRRRHWRDTALTAHGDDARDWLEIAQAYAGEPGTGRQQLAGTIGPNPADQQEERDGPGP